MLNCSLSVLQLVASIHNLFKIKQKQKSTRAMLYRSFASYFFPFLTKKKKRKQVVVKLYQNLLLFNKNSFYHFEGGFSNIAPPIIMALHHAKKNKNHTTSSFIKLTSSPYYSLNSD